VQFIFVENMFFLKKNTLLVAAVCGLLACSDAEKSPAAATEDAPLTAESPLLKLLPATQTGISFQNQIIETFENNITTNINIYNGGGVAVADINNDNLPDLYFVASNGKNRLYLNKGNLQFEDITDRAGVASEAGFETAVTAVDANADGWLDLYINRAGPLENDERRNQLFINNHDLTFSEQAKAYGLDEMSATNSANFFDYDADGDLDCYLLSYPTDFTYTSKIDIKTDPKTNQPVPNLAPKGPYDSDRFFRNDGGKFTDISQQAGVWNFAYGLSTSVTDFDRDGRPDIYVGNDFIQPDILYINDGKGGFTNRLGQFFKHTTQHTMGTDLSDFDNDGFVDLFAADMLPRTNYRQKSTKTTNTQSGYSTMIQFGYFEPVVRNVLQRNNGNGTFSDIACLTNLYDTDWSWSGLLADFDNDGLKDLHVSNGYRRETSDRDFIDFTFPSMRDKSRTIKEQFPDINDFLKQIPTYKTRNFIFQNKGNWAFEDQTGQWMSAHGSWSNGAAWSDLDADGDLDLIVCNIDEPAFVYQNLTREQGKGNYLQLQLRGDAPNPFAVGASARIEYANGQVQYQELYPVRGIFSSVEHLLHFGVGQVSSIDRVLVRWPDGKVQTLLQIPANQRLTLQQADASGYVAHLADVPPTGQFFEEITARTNVNFRHLENEFNDFEAWPLNPWKVSELGPLVAVGDVNGDHLDDFFIGNSFEQAAALYIQRPSGGFQSIAAPVWAADKLYEDHGATFFDADLDGDLDLVVISGGVEATDKQAWQPRLYINLDGKGNFAHAKGALPLLPDVGLRVTAFDYDGDQDLDLFLGGRATPSFWPFPPRSVILRNDRTRFTDVTAQVAPELQRIGMVTDLRWVNIDADPTPELVLVGEWMPITVFKITNGQLKNITPQLGLSRSNGLWWRLETADLDGDGDQDLVTGNWGLNSRFTATDTAPLRCFAQDFDKNDVLDPLMAYYEGGQLYPTVQKEVLIKHIPSLKKQFLYAKDYASATMDKVFPQAQLDAIPSMSAYTLATCWWENRGGTFVRHDLPVQAQVSAVQGIIAHDFTGDGHLDLLLAGNKYGVEVETGRLDASNGCLLAGNGKGQFSWVDNRFSGFWAAGEVRDLALLRQTSTQRPIVVVANNHAAPQFFGLKK
jgi:enediyne biosynthesis protein E4